MYNQTLRLKNLRDSLYKHFFELRDRIAAKTTSICHPSYFCILMVWIICRKFSLYLLMTHNLTIKTKINQFYDWVSV